MNPLYRNLVQHFLLSLSLGTAMYTWIADPKLTGAGFIRLIVGHGAIFLLLALGAAGFFSTPSYALLGIGSLLCLLLTIQWRLHPDHRSQTMMVLYALQWLLSLVVLAQTGTSLAGVLFILSSAMLLGITHYAMLLGHYYLVVPKLTERPLLVCLKIFWFWLVLKMLASGWATFEAYDYLSEASILGDGYLFNWLVISMRWLWGYGALAVLSWFAWRLCRMRSIQSATGVLYIMVFFVFIGELLSAYLYFKHGLSI